MTHTPGPWEIDSNLPPNARSVIARTTGGIKYQTVTVAPYPDGQDYLYEGQSLDEATKEALAYRGPGLARVYYITPDAHWREVMDYQNGQAVMGYVWT